MTVVPSSSDCYWRTQGSPSDWFVSTNQKPKEGAHAFTDESYHIESRGSSVGLELVDRVDADEGSRLAVHGQRGLEHCVAGGRADESAVCGLPRSGGGAVRPGRVRCLGRRLAQNASRLGRPAERRAGRPLAAPPAASQLAGGHRLALGALLRRAEAEPQRDFLRQAPAGDEEVSCLRDRVHRVSRSALHAGGDVGATTRNHGAGARSAAAADSWKRAENQAFALGSSLLQCAAHALPASRTNSFSDAGDVSRANHPEQEEEKAHRTALDQAPKSRLVSPYVAEQN